MNSSKNKSGIRKITVTAVLFSLILFLNISGLGFIKIGVSEVTMLHVPVIIGAIMEGPFVGSVLGLFFGLASLWESYSGASILAPAFQNPVVSVLPRVLIGLFSAYAFSFAMKITKNKLSGSVLTASIVGTLTNTVLVLSLMQVMYSSLVVENLATEAVSTSQAIILGIIAANAPAEIIASCVVTLPVVLALKKIQRSVSTSDAMDSVTEEIEAAAESHNSAAE